MKSILSSLQVYNLSRGNNYSFNLFISYNYYYFNYRHQWTEFNLTMIISGLIIMSFSLIHLLYYYFSMVNVSISDWFKIIINSPIMFFVPLVCLFQVVSAFSNSFIIEVRMFLFC